MIVGRIMGISIYRTGLESSAAHCGGPVVIRADGGQRRNEDNCVKAHGLPDVGTDKQGTGTTWERSEQALCRPHFVTRLFWQYNCLPQKDGYNAHNYNALT